MSIYSVWFYYFLWKLKVFKVERLETLIQLCVLNLWVTVFDFQIYGCGCGSFSIFGLRLRFTIAVMCHTYSVYGIGISGISVPHMFWLAVATVSRTVANKTLWTWALFQSLHSQFEYRVCFTGKVCGMIRQVGEIMFFSDQFLRGVLLFSFGGAVVVVAVAILKIWENKESVLREIRREIDSNDAWQPEENDERFD